MTTLEASVRGSSEGQAIARYWRDPQADGGRLPDPAREPIPCHRFFLDGRPEVMEIRGLHRDGAAELWQLLSSGPVPMHVLDERLTIPQRQLLKRLLRAEMVTVSEARRACTRSSTPRRRSRRSRPAGRGTSQRGSAGRRNAKTS